ncbi:GNAT family N-acetyltransferase [Mucisphaera calidilacus]|uniref:Putative acetyltransferase n=1 Tax=Mucisphaera calidilacus TaxID=2527982 RepID=A0A518C145_9BACT|nr:GNAT family N-acetyltransferase [Mucisphaera calidilacus]QDU72942.1 putative acetyltransferase [Mucisphaera calidilacus]
MPHVLQNLVLREADLTDPDEGAQLVRLIDAYAREPIGQGRPLEPEIRARLVNDLRDHPAARADLALLDGAPVGYAITMLSYSTFKAAPVLNLHDIAVLAEHRGLGIGKALLDYLDGVARSLGCCKMTLEVRTDNPAQRLYERAGFGPGDVDEYFRTRWCND